MMNDIILKIRDGNSVVMLTENASVSDSPEPTVNDADKVIGPDGTIYDMNGEMGIKMIIRYCIDMANKMSLGFLVPLFNSLTICYTFSEPTMATDGTFLFINPGFVHTLMDWCDGTLDGVIFVLVHEVYHNLFKHSQRLANQPDVFTPYDENIDNIASDLEINWVIENTLYDNRTMQQWEEERDPNDPNDVCPYVLGKDGKPVLVDIGGGIKKPVRRLPFVGITKKTNGQYDEKYAGWTYEDIYKDLIKNPNITPPPPPTKIENTIDHTSPESLWNPNVPIPPGMEMPDMDITFALDPDEKAGYEDGWVQAIAEMKAKGLLESIRISNRRFQQLFEQSAASGTNSSYDKGYDNGYAAAIATVKDMIANGVQPTEDNLNKGNNNSKISIKGNRPNVKMPKQTNSSGPSSSSESGNDERGNDDGSNGGNSEGTSDSKQDVMDQIAQIAQNDARRNARNGQSQNGQNGQNRNDPNGQNRNDQGGQDGQNGQNRNDPNGQNRNDPNGQNRNGQGGQDGQNGQNRNGQGGQGGQNGQNRNDPNGQNRNGQGGMSKQEMLDKLSEMQKNAQSKNGETVAVADGNCTGKNDNMMSGKHIVSKSEGKEIAEKAGITPDDIVKRGGVQNIFDNDAEIQKMLKQLGNNIDNDVAKRIKAGLGVIKKTQQPGSGFMKNIIGILKSAGKMTIDWREELALFMSGCIRTSFIGYNNNYIWNDRYEELYDTDEPDSLEHILIFLDTSGSMFSNEDDLKRCLHNIKDIVASTNSQRAEVYLFNYGIYSHTELDVQEIQDNYDRLELKLPVKTGGTSYDQIFDTIQKQYIDKDITPDAVVIMTDSDLYACFDQLPKHSSTDYEDMTVFMIVDDSPHQKVPFGQTLYVSQKDFDIVSRNTVLDESLLYHSITTNKRKCMNTTIHKMNEAVRLPRASKKTTTVSLEDIDKANLSILRSDSEKWKKTKTDLVEAMNKSPITRRIFGQFADVDDDMRKINADSYNVSILVSDDAKFEIFGNVFLYESKKIVMWDQLFDSLKDICPFFTVGTIHGDFTIGYSNTDGVGMPKNMPVNVEGNINILSMPYLTTLGKLPNAYDVNVEDCPLISDEELADIGAITESTYTRPLRRTRRNMTSMMKSIVESRIAIAKQFKPMNESFSSTQLAKMFNSITGSKPAGTAKLTGVSAQNRNILKKFDKDNPIMWSEITDDMITTTKPVLKARSKAVLERRDQDNTDDWGIRIVCDEDGKIVLIITGNNKSKKNPKYDRSMPNEYRYIYDWTDGKGWLFVNKDLVPVIEERRKALEDACSGFFMYVNAKFDLGIKQISTDMSMLQNLVNNVHTDGVLVKDAWRTFKNKELYVDLTSKTVQNIILSYYTNTLGYTQSTTQNEILKQLESAAKAIEIFKPLFIDYTKSSLSNLTPVRVVDDDTAIGYHVVGMKIATFELIPDMLVTIYDIDSKHNSRASRQAGDDTLPLGSINPYDREIADTGYFDVEKNREDDEVEKAKFGYLNNLRKRRMIQHSRTNSITGSRVNTSHLNDPRLSDMSDRGVVFSPETDARSQRVYDTITKMKTAAETRLSNTSDKCDKFISTLTSAVKKKDVLTQYVSLEDLVKKFIDAGTNLQHQLKIADSIEIKYANARVRSNQRGYDRGYADTVSSQVADALDALQDDFIQNVNNDNSLRWEMRNISKFFDTIADIDVTTYLEKDDDDLINKLSNYYKMQGRPVDTLMTNASMSDADRRYTGNRNHTVKILRTALEKFVSAYSYVISLISNFRRTLK